MRRLLSVFGIKKKTPEILRALARVIEGTPKVETFEVGNSTSHQIAASAVGS